MPAPGPSAVDHELVEHVDDEGRRFGRAHVDHEGADGVGIHFSAFFGAWGDARPYRATFQGYFHRLRMLGSDPSCDWLFHCDTHGVHDNGSYYLGQGGDLFVQRAVRATTRQELDRRGHRPERAVLLGSSMGATGALATGLDLGAAGIVAICPHIDLDTSARHQDRMAEVSWICPDGDALAPHNHHLTRSINRALDAWLADRPLPRLFLQSCEDDIGVHHEQVVPLAERWRSMGGDVHLDVRPEGGHTSDHATRAVLLDINRCFLDGTDPDLERYRTDPDFVGTPTVPPVSHRVRRRLSLARKRLLGRRP